MYADPDNTGILYKYFEQTLETNSKQVWIISDNFEKIWPNLDKFAQFWTYVFGGQEIDQQMCTNQVSFRTMHTLGPRTCTQFLIFWILDHNHYGKKFKDSKSVENF